ncbi:hypothetical protein [Clostridium perfringens]|uniref:hypothetical protein n=1 Tax=Clostridium perfringens TaxID=1502 RepID=UPI0018D5EDBB|nr:hypothetical protein [Clostridium perfringens]MDU4248728.1 hypothetical protein [Thomasclavelia ramosa]MDU1112043.1 hypothetical protein [Clostridium perfringens]MDU1597804.1 hypothetical protein [Clostridium perfringens]MDU1958511.1 hypothetical protein [Clostridium perfringens]QPS26673.1 hypothetical protein I6G61_09525 [Clostridium perfringens]
MRSVNYFIMRLKMFISSYFPLYAILLILYNDKFNSLCKIKDILKFKDVTISIFIISLIVLCLISIMTCIDLLTTKWSENHTITSIESTGDTIISYLMTYIVPILSIDPKDNKTLTVNILLYLLIGFMYIKLKVVYLNPLWLFCGYYIYKADNNSVIISNFSYGELRGLIGERLKSSLICDKIYLIRKKDNE